MAKLIDIIGKPISGEWGTDDLAGTGIPVLRTTNFTNEGVVDYRDVVTRQITKKNLSEKMLRHGDIILEKSGGSDKQPVGRVIFFESEENKYLFNNFTGLLRVKDRAKWIPKYVFYALFANYIMGGTVRYENKTTGLHNLQTDAYVSAVDIPDCSIEKQKKIVSCLDEVIGLIGKQRQQLAKLDELVKSRFVEMFGDADLAQTRPEWRSVSEIGTVVGGATPKTTNDEFWDGLYRWITPAELENESGYIFDSVRKITEAGVKSCALTELPVGTVILSSRAPIGKVAIAGNTFYCNQGFKNIICNQDINPVFLYSLLRMNTRYLNSLGRGVTFKEISKAIVENIRIPVPPRMHQDRFAAFVAEVDKSKLAVKQSLEKLETLKKSLMQQYFG